jgi:hypothetical protein
MAIDFLRKLFTKKPAVSTLYSERTATLSKWREEFATRRQELTWEHQRQVDSLDNGPGKELADFEAAVRDFEAKHAKTIVAEALAALRGAASTFGDQPRSSAIAVRIAWRRYEKRLTEELGPEHEPNALLLAAAFLDPSFEGALGTEFFLSGVGIGGALAGALLALFGDSPPRAVYALQQLDIAVDETARVAISDASEQSEKLAHEIVTSASHAEVASRVKLGDRLSLGIGEATHRIAKQRSESVQIAPFPPLPPKAVTVPPTPPTSPPLPAADGDPDDVEYAMAYGT